MPWPLSSASTVSAAPPVNICAAVLIIGSGMSWRLDQIEPNAQLAVAVSSASAPRREPARSPPTLSRITPTKPTSRPVHSSRRGHWPNAVPNSAANSGMPATAIAARPDDTLCCAQQTMPLPKPSSSVPVIAQLRHCSAVSRAAPRQRRNAYSAAPAARKRTAAIENGG